MSDFRQDEGPHSEWLSAVVDGQATQDEVARACASWRDEPDVRARWGTYHLIGDVMRSEDLAQAEVGQQESFLEGFRARLAQEPVVLAPAGLSARHPGHIVVDDAPVRVAPRHTTLAEPMHRRVWSGPAAVAASFALIVGVLVTGGLIDAPTALNPSGQAQLAGGAGLTGGSGRALLPEWTTAQALSAAPVSFHEGGQGNQGHAVPAEFETLSEPHLDQAPPAPMMVADVPALAELPVFPAVELLPSAGLVGQ